MCQDSSDSGKGTNGELPGLIAELTGQVLQNGIHCFFEIMLNLAFPQSNNMPAGFFQLLLVQNVVLNIFVEFLNPEICVGGRRRAIFTPRVPMPVTAVDKYNLFYILAEQYPAFREVLNHFSCIDSPLKIGTSELLLQFRYLYCEYGTYSSCVSHELICLPCIPSSVQPIIAQLVVVKLFFLAKTQKFPGCILRGRICPGIIS